MSVRLRTILFAKTGKEDARERHVIQTDFEVLQEGRPVNPSVARPFELLFNHLIAFAGGSLQPHRVEYEDMPADVADQSSLL